MGTIVSKRDGGQQSHSSFQRARRLLYLVIPISLQGSCKLCITVRSFQGKVSQGSIVHPSKVFKISQTFYWKFLKSLKIMKLWFRCHGYRFYLLFLFLSCQKSLPPASLQPPQRKSNADHTIADTMETVPTERQGPRIRVLMKLLAWKDRNPACTVGAGDRGRHPPAGAGRQGGCWGSYYLPCKHLPQSIPGSKIPLQGYVSLAPSIDKTEHDGDLEEK